MKSTSPSQDSPDPAGPVYVLKDGARLGPYTIDDLLELIDEGTLRYEDVCLREGEIACERLRDVLDWDGDDDPEIGKEKAEVEKEIPESEDEAEEDEDDEDEEYEEDDEDDEEEEADADFEFDEEEPLPPARPIRRRPSLPKNPNLILYAGHPSVLSFPKTLAVILFAIGGAIYGRQFSSWWLFGGLLAALFGVSWILLQRSMQLYLVTPRRVELIKGLIAKNSNEVRIEDIRTINVRTPGVRGLLGVGTVEFASAGGGAVEVTFADVQSAHRIKGLVRRIQDARDEAGESARG